MSRSLKPSNHYETLGVTYDATALEIDDAYDRRLDALLPDEFDDPRLAVQKRSLFERLRSTLELANVIKSYKVLADEAKRTQYDADLKVYSMPKYILDMQIVRFLAKALMIVDGLLVLTFVWQFAKTTAISSYLVEGTFNITTKTIVASALLIVCGEVLKYFVINRRWKGFTKTEAIEKLKKQFDWMMIWFCFALGMASFVWLQAWYALL